jgi:toxin-antitoxin system PIN domain toxin
VTTFLLDVNLLLALSDPKHEHHEIAHRWFAAHCTVNRGDRAWATCPTTENGYVRIASHPRYPNRQGDAQVVLALLRRLCAAEGHCFWPEDVPLREMLEPGTAIASAQVTDLYLLGLAARKGGQLATLDQRIPASVVRGGLQALAAIPVSS